MLLKKTFLNQVYAGLSRQFKGLQWITYGKNMVALKLVDDEGDFIYVNSFFINLSLILNKAYFFKILSNCKSLPLPPTFVIKGGEILESNCQAESHMDEKSYFVKIPDQDAGNGIQVVKSIEEVMEYSRGCLKQLLVVQPELRSFLIDGRKTSIRLFWILINDDEQWSSLLFKEGVIMTSHRPYQYGSTDIEVQNIVTDDTNNVVLDSEHDLYQTVYQQAKPIVKTVTDTYSQLFMVDRVYADVVLFAIDFLLDEDKQLYLIEVNGGPQYTEFSVKIRVKEAMIEEIYTPLFSGKAVRPESFFKLT